MQLSDAYQILGVAAGASEATVREAYRDMVKVWHPDRHENDPRLKVKAVERLRAINEARSLIEQAGFPSAEKAASGYQQPSYYLMSGCSASSELRFHELLR